MAGGLPVRDVVSWAGPEGASGECGFDRLILTAGSVNKLLPIPGVADYAHGFRSIAEAMYLRDHIIRQLELAAVAADHWCRPSDRRHERELGAVDDLSHVLGDDSHGC